MDKIILGAILGMSETDQLEVYRATVDLVKNRIEKAESLKNELNSEEQAKTDRVVSIVVDRIKGLS